MYIGIVPTNDKDTSSIFLMNETDLHAILSTQYLGTDPLDIGNILSFFVMSAGHNVCGLFYENVDEVNAKIVEVCAKITEEGLVEEIKATIKIGR